MNIRKLHYYHRKFLFLKAWYVLVPALVCTVLAINGLRSNYSQMVTLREAVYQADQQNGDVEGALLALRKHVYSHMNTNISTGNSSIKPPIQLKARYDRLAAANAEQVKAQNAQVAAQGEQVCAAQFPATGYNAPRVECIQAYVGANAVAEQPVTDGLYKFDFVSPRWSPDLAGISIILAVIFYILFISRVLLERYMRKKLDI